MSTGSSSLGDLTDLESVKSGLTSNFEDVGAAQLQVLEMAATIRKMNEEMEKLKVKVEDSTEKESILTSINGSWQIICSIKVEEYLERWNPSDIDNALFQVGSLHFQFDKDTGVLTTSETLGTRKYSIKEAKLGERSVDGKLSFVTFEEKNSLVTVHLQGNGEEFGRVKRFMKNGQLHVVTKRFAMSCTRIYEKMGTKARYSGVAESGRVEVLEEELARKDEVIDELKKEMEDQKKKNDKMMKEMEEELFKKNVEMNVLALRNRILKQNGTINGSISSKSLETRILGLWKKYEPSGNVERVPRTINFSIDSVGGLRGYIQENDYKFSRWVYCGLKNDELKTEGSKKVRDYIEDNNIWSEAFDSSGNLIEASKMWIEGEELKITKYWSQCQRECSYKREN